MRRYLLLVLLSAAACGRPAPTTPTAVSAPALPTPAPTPAPVVLAGRVFASVTGEPLGGLTVDLAGQTSGTDSTGSFRYELPATWAGSFPRLTLSGPAIVTRSLLLSLAGSRDVSTDAIALGNGFDLDYYRRLVRDDFDSPGVLRTLRRWTQAPRLYLKTVDEAGQPIESLTLDAVSSAFGDDAAAWTGGRFGLAGIERGVETREGVSGWITVKWPTTYQTGVCGRAQIATDGGWIELNYYNPQCACPGTRMYRGVVRHELGHAMGFYHTGQSGDNMNGTVLSCDAHPTARERLHAAIAYARAFGNADPDSDPSSSIQSVLPPIVIVN